MKMFNRLVNIIIFLLAIVIVAMAFLLFQKREQLVKGWGKMSQSISSAATTLDKGSGTDYAKKLNAQSLDHKHYADLDKLLPEVAKQADGVIKQRGELTSALNKFGTIYELPNVPAAAALSNIKTYNKDLDVLLGNAENYANINNNVLGRMASIGGKVGVDIQAAALKGEGAVATAEKISSGVNSLKTKADTFADNLSTIAGVVGAEGDFGNATYQSAVASTVDKVKEMKGRHDQYLRERDSARAEVKQLVAKVGQRDETIKQRDRKITGLERQLERYTRVANQNEEPAKIDPNDPKLLRMIKGRIIEINAKWDFVVVNLGTQTQVEQKNGNKMVKNPVNIPNNEEMVVVRGLETDQPQYVGKIKLVQVEDNCSIANILSGNKSSDFKVGDVVYFPKDVIANIQKKKAAK